MPITLLRHKRIVFRQFCEPFSLDDLFNLNRSDVALNGSQADLNGPLMEDFSKIDLGQLAAEEIQHYVKKNKRSEVLTRRFSNNSVACVARDIRSFARLRLYGVYAEIAGVRDEDNLFVTDDYQQGINWLMAKIGKGSGQGHQFFEALQGADLIPN